MSNYYSAGCHALYNRPVPFGEETPVVTVPEGFKMEGGKLVPKRDYAGHFKDKAVAMGALVVIAFVGLKIFGGK